MSLSDILSQYTKLAGQLSGENQGSGLLGMAKSLIGNEAASTLIQKFLTNLSPDIIQKLSALKVLGDSSTPQPNSSESFIDLFKTLSEKFTNQDTNQQVADLAKPDNANLVGKALDIAKSLGINLDNLI
ncbi:hypothetical protein DKL61_00105 [Gammaproteobacteria bacterium ESL0073]|nr:hypothetical protein DKL61_00105 [Gammaproteobacteria bacterium ESL0073]